MKRVGLILLFVLLVGTGCGRANTPAASPDNKPGEVQKEKVTTIVSAAVPERDPFGGQKGADVPAQGGVVPSEGRDPFMLAAADNGWQSQQGKVSPSGRDPFAEGSGIVPETEPPVDPDPGPGEEPEPPVGGGVVLSITTVDRCWLDVFVDETRVLRTNVPLGETLNWQGERVIELAQVGREWALSVTVNGQDLGIIEELVPHLISGPITRAGVQISLREIYPGGVLVGLRFSVRE